MRVTLFDKEDGSFENFENVEAIQSDKNNEEIEIIYFPTNLNREGFSDRFPASRYQISSVYYKDSGL